MRSFILILAISLAYFTTSSAQWGIGGRFGGSTGVDLKHYSSGLLFEAIAGQSFDEDAEGFSLTLLGEKFGPLNGDGNLGAILGVGETMVFTDDFLLGISGILGFDWRIGRIGLQVDWLPTYIFINDSHFSPINAAFTARWMLGSRKIN